MCPDPNTHPGPRGRPGRRDTVRRALGRHGEDLACTVLADSGLRVIARNWRCRDGEIDVVAAHDGLVVFCEVKTRRSDRLGTPAAAVTPDKQQRLRLLATAFLAQHRARPRTVRFDVVAVTWRTGQRPVVEHLVGVF